VDGYSDGRKNKWICRHTKGPISPYDLLTFNPSSTYRLIKTSSLDVSYVLKWLEGNIGVQSVHFARGVANLLILYRSENAAQHTHTPMAALTSTRILRISPFTPSGFPLDPKQYFADEGALGTVISSHCNKRQVTECVPVVHIFLLMGGGNRIDIMIMKRSIIRDRPMTTILAGCE
jgi:hypothetical protein